MAEMLEQTHWQRPDVLKIQGREAAFGYRYVKKSDVERRLGEGWVIVTSPMRVRKEGGTAVDTAQRYRELVLMKMPKHMIEERNAFYRERHERRIRASARGAHMSSVHQAATSDNSDSNELAGIIGSGLKIREGVKTDEGLVHTNNMDIPLEAHPDDLAADAEVLREMKDKQRESQDGGQGDEGPLAPKYRRKQKRR